MKATWGLHAFLPLIDLSSQGSCRPSPKQNRRLFQNKNKVNYRTSITAIEHTLS